MKLLLLILLLCLASCTRNPAQPASVVPSPPTSLTAESALSAFKAAKLPVQDEAIYTVDTDPNKLLGRPNQYTGKVSWNDGRMDKVTDPATASSLKESPVMTVEVFASPEDLENRRRYVETITKSMSVLAEYQFVHKNALLRLYHDLTPDQAAEYERVLKTL